MQLPKCLHPNCENIVSLKSSGKPAQHCSLKCRGQHNSLKSREKSKLSCLKKYGVENPKQLSEVIQKGKDSCIKKYGVDNPSKSDLVKNKKKNTCMLNYGVEYPLQSEEIQKKVLKTNLKRYKVENPFQIPLVKEKIKDFYLDNFGVEFVGQVPEFKERIKQTNLRNFGVENPAQCPMIQNKIMKKGITKKSYMFPSGKIILVQGYENYALDYYLTLYKEDDIIIGDATKIPVISYLDEFGKSRKYFPDIYIPSENLIIEVKSTYTYKKYEQRNICKQQECLLLGYKFEFYIGRENTLQRNKRLKQSRDKSLG